MTSSGADRHSTPDAQPTGRRFGQLARVRPEKIDDYKRLHAQIWPDVARGLTENQLHNYSIWLQELAPGEHYLFGCFEYTGDDFDADMARMNEDAMVQKWEQAAGDECLLKVSPDDEYWWVDLEEIFHDGAAADRVMDLAQVQHFGQVIGVRPERVDAYRYLHRYAWPELRAALRRGNVRHARCCLAQLGEKYYVFRYFEHIGDDLHADMTLLSADPAVQAWVRLIDEACHLPIRSCKPDERWAMMEKVFYQP